MKFSINKNNNISFAFEIGIGYSMFLDILITLPQERIDTRRC